MTLLCIALKKEERKQTFVVEENYAVYQNDTSRNQS